MVYGKTKSNGAGKESDCDREFASSAKVMTNKHENFKSAEKDKYTIVIWLEGNDPDCTNDIIGGTMKLGIDPQAFVDWYTSNGWKVGKNPMKDWKAAVRTWERKEVNHGRNGSADSAVESQKFRDIGTDL